MGEFEMGSSSSESASISSMSSSSALNNNNNNNKNQIKRPVKIKKSTEKTTPKHHNYQSGGVSDILSPVVSIMREKNDDQVKLNFTLSVLLAGFQVSLVNDQAKEVNDANRLPTNTILVTRIQTQADMNNIYEKLSFRVKKFEVFSNDNGNNSVLLTSDPGVFESRVISSKAKPEK